MTLLNLRAWRARFTLALVGPLMGLLAAGSGAALAQEDPPGRVGRLAEVQGTVSWYDSEQGSWTDAERNRPLTGGDRLSTGAQGRAELRVGSTVLRLGAASELEVLRLDDERMVFQLHSGSLALRVRSREVASDIEVDTQEARFKPERSGHYRFDRVDDTTLAGAWRGTLRVDDREGFVLETGQRAEFWRERRGLKFKWSALPGDSFADWVQRDDQRDDQRSASNRYVSPEMTGAEDLDRAGRWDSHPEYGAIWYPSDVRDDWAPYRYGRWAWVSPWGWTWVDDSAWGFAPFHYGRWVNWRGRWGWCPGDYVARPVYAPALVAWLGGPRVGISINIGGPAIGWVPLAPREWYVPQHRVTSVYVDRLNPRPPGYRGEWRRPEPVAGGPPMRYGNQGQPGGVTVVPREVMVRREPVGRHAAGQQDAQRQWSQQPAQAAEPPQRVGPPPPRVTSTVLPDNRPAPVQAPAQTPAQAPAQTPTPATSQTPAQTPAQAPTPVRVDRTEPPRNDRADRPDRGDRGDRNPRGSADRDARDQRDQRDQRSAPAPAAVPLMQPAPQRPQAPAPAPAAVQPQAAPAAQPAPQAVGPQRPREDDRKRGPDNNNRGGKDNKESREQQR